LEAQMSRCDITDAEFRAAVATLRVPGMGTEAVAPWLAATVRLLRPRWVLEVGMGYTTPFLAAALADAEAEVAAEAQELAAKTEPYLAEGAELDDAWLDAEPPLVAPGFYLEPYHPRLVAVDNLSIEGSSAPRVQEVLRGLGLDGRVTVVNADLRACADLLPDGCVPIDLAWVDAWDCLYFVDHFWDLINPDGGLVIMHYLMTYPEGEAILKYLAQAQRSRPGEMEVVNLLEPHKLTQNSLTVLRRTSGVKERRYASIGGRVNYGALREEARAQSVPRH
jgi:predicted O-methyltransferase YrrM